MAMEARIKTKDGDRIYRSGLREITLGGDQVYLFYGEKGGGTGGPDMLTENGETLEEAEVEVVKLEGGQSIEEQDDLVAEFQEDPDAFNEKYKD